jgi:exonuclease III
LLQETHSKLEDENVWKREWGGEIVFSHGSSSSRGTCIMFAPNMAFTIHDKYIDQEGRFVIINVTINDVTLTLVNIYGPNNDNDVFFMNVFENIELMGNDNRIIGGDFNCILDNNMDKRGGRPTHAHKNTQQLLNTYMDETNLVDIWRKQHPTERQFTYHSTYRGQYLFSRIDFFLVSFGLSSLVNKSVLSPSFLSDHSPTEITINLEEFKRGKGFWKLNCSLLKDRDYVDLIKKTIIDTVKDNINIDDVLLWEMIKLQVRGNSIKYSSRKKRSNNNILSALQKRPKFRN